MAYIGNTQLNQNYVPAVDYFSGNGSTTAFTLSRPVASVAAVQAVISNVPQNPGSAFTVSGSTITFTSAPPSGTNNIYVYYTSPNTQVVQPGQGTVGPTQIDGGYTLWNKVGSDATYTAGNLGLGVTPSAWGSPYKAFQVGDGSVFAASSGNIQIGENAYYDGSGYKYINTAQASRYYQSGGSHVWSTAASGTAGNAITFTQAMTLDASGNLGIGTSSPYSQLDVYSAISSPTTGEATGVGSIRITNGVAALSSAGGLEFKVAGDTNGYGAKIQALNSGGAQLVFANRAASATWVERMRIDSSGNLSVGSASASGKVSVSTDASQVGVYVANSNVSPAATFFGQWTAAAPNNTSVQFMLLGDSVGYRMYVQANGGIYNYSANNSNLSDRREKTNFAPAVNYLDKICAIPVQTFNYIDQNLEEDPGLTLGVVAQDVQDVAPELVTESNWGTKEEPKMRLSVYQTDLQYALMKAIQELNAKVEAQAAEIAALKGQA